MSQPAELKADICKTPVLEKGPWPCVHVWPGGALWTTSHKPQTPDHQHLSRTPSLCLIFQWKRGYSLFLFFVNILLNSWIMLFLLTLRVFLFCLLLTWDEFSKLILEMQLWFILWEKYTSRQSAFSTTVSFALKKHFTILLPVSSLLSYNGTYLIFYISE